MAAAVTVGRPSAVEHSPYHEAYISLVPETDVLAALEAQPAEVELLATRATMSQETFAYAPGKWTVREVVDHLTDVERVFGHRAFCISRGERASLPGFDENDYVARSGSNGHRLCDLAEEFTMVRAANMAVLRRLDAEAWVRLGTANGNPVSVRALAYMMAGHVRHHLRLLRDRYGLA